MSDNAMQGNSVPVEQQQPVSPVEQSVQKAINEIEDSGLSPAEQEEAFMVLKEELTNNLK